MKVPSSLFKYHKYCFHSYKNLVNHSFYFADPKLFNDPFDCNFRFRSDPFTNIEIQKFKNKYIQDESSFNDRLKLENFTDEEWRLGLSSGINQYLQELSVINKGVCCFSETYQSLLMWGHYADSYRGFCVGFKTNNQNMQKIRKVAYCRYIKEIDGCKHYLEDSDIFEELFLTKPLSWKYEKEWRLVGPASQSLLYDPQIIDSIYFGPRMTTEEKEEIIWITLKMSNKIKYFDSFLDQEEYKINFVQKKKIDIKRYKCL